MMPSFALVAVWSNPPPSPIGYLSKLHGSERQLFYPVSSQKVMKICLNQYSKKRLHYPLTTKKV
jgi:hypothetical protein